MKSNLCKLAGFTPRQKPRERLKAKDGGSLANLFLIINQSGRMRIGVRRVETDYTIFPGRCFILSTLRR